jgi:hypothetical protein
MLAKPQSRSPQRPLHSAQPHSPRSRPITATAPRIQVPPKCPGNYDISREQGNMTAHSEGTEPHPKDRPMRISARNALPGKIVD